MGTSIRMSLDPDMVGDVFKSLGQHIEHRDELGTDGGISRFKEEAFGDTDHEGRSRRFQ